MLAPLLLGAQSPLPPPMLTCAASGWAPFPQTEVRSAPSPKGRVVARLSPRASGNGDEEITGTLPEFRIRGFSNGWFWISHISYGDYGDPAPSPAPYAGEGWIRGDRVSGQLAAGRLHSAPSSRSRSRPFGKEPDAVEVRRLLACQGSWVRIEADIGTGWVRGMCSNQATTCS